eukprot:scaffold9228_cov118-Skeletonema_dohrnii-CCMP3373.AAC.2
MGRKRNQGKARKAAKAKAREEAAKKNGGNDNNQTADGPEQLLMQRLQSGNDNNVPSSPFSPTINCNHGFEEIDTLTVFCLNFVNAFSSRFYDDAAKGAGVNISSCLLGATKATEDEFAEVWYDSSNMEITISLLLRIGTQYLLEDKHNYAGDYAIFARFLEQYAAVRFKQTQALINWSKIIAPDKGYCDLHTLVEFFRRRIPCKCLDEKYQEVKSIPKMGICYNPECHFPDECVERSKLLYCSRCRIVTYCSSECQKADWTKHKPNCDKDAGLKAKFDAKQQNT